MNNNLSEGISALKAGNREAARRYLSKALQEDPNSERAWQWMYNAANNDSERKKCLNEILRINPANQKAAQMLAQTDGLNVTEQKKVITPASAVPIAPKDNKNLILGISAASLLLIACCCSILIWSFSNQSQTENYIAEYGGSQDVYDKIASLNNCAELQAQFDLASQNNAFQEPGSPNALATTGYMVAADQRMKELGCYEQQPMQPPEALLANTAIKLPAFTQTAIPSLTAIPQPTQRATPRPTWTAEPTLTAFPSFTPFTQQSLPGAAVCSCSGDLYSCPDYQTQSSAQACFDYCVAQGAGDIHKLDGNDNDGCACEGLP